MNSTEYTAGYMPPNPNYLSARTALGVELSQCCNCPALTEAVELYEGSGLWGRCSCCKEMAEFTSEVEGYEEGVA